MKILAALTTSTSVSLICVRGSQKNPSFVEAQIQRCSLPNSEDEGKRLSTMLATIRALITDKAPDHIAILQAGNSKFGNSSQVRPKIEALIQIAAADDGRKCEIVHPVSLKAREKKFEKIVGSSLEIAFNDGGDFSSKEKRSLALLGWSQLPE
jgi:hypothetical protein